MLHVTMLEEKYGVCARVNACNRRGCRGLYKKRDEGTKL
jgi:hypothetical protein